MNRRDFLHRAGATAAVAALAGCVGGADPGSSPGGETTDAGTTTGSGTTTNPGTTTDGAETTVGDAKAFRTITLGERENVAFPKQNRPRTLRVRNAADSARTISVSVARAGERLLDERIEFPADGHLAVVLNEPADYAVTVGVRSERPATSTANGTATSGATSASASSSGASFRIPRTLFDCNRGTVDVAVTPDGEVKKTVTSTKMACGDSPNVAETSIAVGEGECGTENRASVSYEGDRVRVDGVVRAPTPNSKVELAAANYDGQSGTLTVRVRATSADSGEGASVQCVGAIPYEATVRFERALPESVVVVHESSGQTVEVTTSTRGGSETTTK
ncbi:MULTISPECIES: twin-arginine translocation signal domain-containing protein [Halorussus]|uniref:twin-arginine translocation signal domain-containing protein n=1 Tax=Halorussus TaxID=1070314 RepID=UPI00209D258F|nr:twin-arginine translocation signal domain-containing protein [Halorussus vallis]USZ76665.1 twin-arginine translocation signal domain-containing protein [Halorussus vallis]